jgi:hypothetical protein
MTQSSRAAAPTSPEGLLLSKRKNDMYMYMDMCESFSRSAESIQDYGHPTALETR